MALKTLVQFPLFARPEQQRPWSEVRLSRWNNANAEEFMRRERTQKEIEDELRFDKRFHSANKIADGSSNCNSSSDRFRSTGTPSTPSRPSIPGKSSKYSKQHPAFRRIVRLTKVPVPEAQESGVKISETGVSYMIPDAPFEFQYSYTETPKEKPLKLREPPIAPFGPSTMPRPWTGRKPLPPSKKKFDFDSFQLPPPHKKGVKPVQAPGPFLPGSAPKYALSLSREEILGEPLTKEEIDHLLKTCINSNRQLNMGRDGLTHNMLDNIHALWKRRRVCKIKCKGVCTVHMDNVRQQLEEKTGGKIIYNRGGVVYLFRGRNYNYKTRPCFPLMLWKPITPVYPRLIKRVPDGLTLEESSEMRKKGRKLTPICKLGKNGVYCDLVNNVSEAFEACELVRINCQGMNPSDYRKIGAKLKDLVPCVLISFEHEHILMWRGTEWKSSLPELVDEAHKEPNKSEVGKSASIVPPSGQDVPGSCLEEASFDNLNEAPLDSEEDADPEDLSSVILYDNMSASIGDIENNVKPSLSVTSLSCSPWTQGVLLLREQAIEGGRAVVLDESCLDADYVYERAVSLAQSAPPGPVFRPRPKPKTVAVQKREKHGSEDSEVVEEAAIFSGRKVRQRNNRGKKDFTADFLHVVPQGSLRVDELAKLLA